MGGGGCEGLAGPKARKNKKSPARFFQGRLYRLSFQKDRCWIGGMKQTSSSHPHFFVRNVDASVVVLFDLVQNLAVLPLDTADGI